MGTIKICTVTIPKEHLEAIEQLVSNGLYPSRSEVIRVATHNFLVKKLKQAKDIRNFEKSEDISKEDIIRIPVETKTEEKQYKTYKILKKLY